jgi:tRNA-2-methylthio-N6-dimethylallyladenosine synthase
MKKKALILTYGCQMNINDSEKMKTVLTSINYDFTDDEREADLIIMNTCTVRQGAADRVYARLSQMKTLKELKNNLIIGVAGCLAQEKQSEILEKNKHANFVIGNQNIYRLPEIIKRIENQEENHIILTTDLDEIPPRIDASFSSIVAYVSITYGCSNKCSYCIVPYVRGKLRSVPIDDVLEEVKSYLIRGYKEIVLVGQNVNSYGKDLKVKFSELLKRVSEIEGKFRIRFISPHPAEFTEDVIDVIANSSKICNSIHFPLQSGSSRILKKMFRNHTKERYIFWTDRLRERLEDLAITTDIIVGFPGETEEDFLDTLDVVEQASFDNSYMYMYSQRDFTPAAVMEEQIPHEVKLDRLKRLIKLQNRVSSYESKKYVDTVQEVLVERISPKNPELLEGRTDQNKIVHFSGNEAMIGQFVNVKILSSKTWTLYGEVC